MPFLSPNQQRQSTDGVTAYNLQSKYNLQFTYRNRTNRAIISIRFHLPCCPVVSHFGHLPIRVAYSWLTRCLAKHTLREWANSYNAQNRAPVALIPLSVDISVSVCLSVCLRISTRYRPGGGRRDDMPPRRWQFDGGKNRGGSTSVRGPVRSPHISGGRRWLSCRQPVCL